jgi:hypothetical protein
VTQCAHHAFTFVCYNGALFFSFCSQPALEAGRQQYFPQPRAASLEVAASTLAAPTPSAPASTTAAQASSTTTSTSAPVTTTVSNATVSGDSKKRSPEVQDSIAAVASQLLNERPAIMDMRKPVAPAPIVQQQQAEPDKKWEKVVVTNAVPLKVSAQTDRPVTKVPPISEISTKLPATTTPKLAAMPTRYVEEYMNQYKINRNKLLL